VTRAWIAAFAAIAPACSGQVEPPAVSELEQHTGSVCADGSTVYGIDVSRFQGTIDWTQVQASGVVYAWIQISRSLTDVDMQFDYNWSHAKTVGVLRGAYQRFHPGQDVLGQADLFLQKLGLFQAGDLPPMLDIEDSDGLTGTAIAAAVGQWLDHVQAAVGVKPIIYTGLGFWRDTVGGADYSQYPLWIANYSATCPPIPDPWTKWTFHQYSSTAHIPGITQNTVDVDKFNGTLDQLKALGTNLPCDVIAPQGGIIDDSSPCFVAGGNVQSIRHVSAGYGSALQWTYTSDAPQPTNDGVWQLNLAEAGHYRVEISTPAPYAQSKQAVYQVTHAGATDRIMLDQSKQDGWQVLGDLDFAVGADQAIRLDDNTGEPLSTNTQLVFDAIRLTRVDGPPDPGTPVDAGMPTSGHPSGGCNARGSSTGWLAVALVAFAVRRRRARP
jgi:GH25 family lysozyme M1 (1,4-beta-N-acetylmuramidase)